MPASGLVGWACVLEYSSTPVLEYSTRVLEYSSTVQQWVMMRPPGLISTQLNSETLANLQSGTPMPIPRM